MDDWQAIERLVLDEAAAVLEERGAPDFDLADLRGRLDEAVVSDEDLAAYFPEMSAVWRGLALVRGLEVPALDGQRARISNLDLRAVSAFVHARLLERRVAEMGPGAGRQSPVIPEMFWAMLAPRDVPAEHLVHAICDLALPSLSERGEPAELIAWLTETEDWHVVFYTSLPEPRAWLGPEHDLMPLGGLDYMLHVQHDAEAPQAERFTRFAQGSIGHVWGASRGPAPDVVLMAEHPDLFREGAPAGPQVVWDLLEVETAGALSLARLQEQIPHGQPVVLIRNGFVVLERPR